MWVKYDWSLVWAFLCLTQCWLFGVMVNKPDSWSVMGPFAFDDNENKRSLLICFSQKCHILVRTSTTAKDTEYRSEVKNIKFFWHNVCFTLKTISNRQNIWRKIHFHIKANKTGLPDYFINKQCRVLKYVHTSIFTCAHYLLYGDLITTNSPWKLFRCVLDMSNVSVSMEINDSLHIFKDSISREILELTIVPKSWIGCEFFGVVRNGFNFYQWHCSHLTTKTKWIIIIVVNGTSCYRCKKFLPSADGFLIYSSNPTNV